MSNDTKQSTFDAADDTPALAAPATATRSSTKTKPASRLRSSPLLVNGQSSAIDGDRGSTSKGHGGAVAAGEKRDSSSNADGFDMSKAHDLDLEPIISKYDRGWRRIVCNFSPSWFSVTMGTGIVSVLLITIPYQARWLYWLSVIMFCLNALLFALATLISVLRYTLYPEIWAVMIKDPVNSLFLGTVPMGFATLIEEWVFICVPAWGEWATWVAWIAWMVDAAVAVGVTVSLSFVLVSQPRISHLDRITAGQLLPIASTIVAAGTAAETAAILPNPQHALGTIIAGYILWGMATPLALTVIVIYYQRLAVHKLPSREVIVSCFLPLGPLGFGGYTIMYLGRVALPLFEHVTFFQIPSPSAIEIASVPPNTFASTPPVSAGPILYTFGLLAALVLFSFALTFLLLSLASIYVSRPLPFNMGWWGFVFPLGVLSASTIEIGVELPSRFFRILGTIFATAVCVLWCVVAIGTVRGAWTGKLFHAPCLRELKERQGGGVGVGVERVTGADEEQVR